MPRKRTDTPEWLPKYVTENSLGWWVQRSYLGRINGKTKWGPEKRITKAGCSPSEFFKVYNALQPKMKEILISKYFEPDLRNITLKMRDLV